MYTLNVYIDRSSPTFARSERHLLGGGGGGVTDVTCFAEPKLYTYNIIGSLNNCIDVLVINACACYYCAMLTYCEDHQIGWCRISPISNPAADAHLIHVTTTIRLPMSCDTWTGVTQSSCYCNSTTGRHFVIVTIPSIPIR